MYKMNEKKEYLIKNSFYNYSNTSGNVITSAISFKLNLIAYCCNEKIIILNKNDLSLVKILGAKRYYPSSILFDDDGKNLLVWNSNGTIDLWAIESGIRTIIYKHECYHHDQGGLISFKKNIVLVSCNPGSEFKRKTVLFDLNIRSLETTNEWILDKDYYPLQLSNNGQFLICNLNTVHGGVDVYDFTNHRILKNFETPYRIRHAIMIGKKNLICSGESFVFIFDFNNGNLIDKIKTKGQVENFSVTPHGNYLAIAMMMSGSVLLYDLSEQKIISDITCGKYLKNIHIDAANKNIITVADSGLNLITYPAESIPKLTDLCVKKITNTPNFFQTKEINKKELGVLQKYFDVEIAKPEADNNDGNKQSSNDNTSDPKKLGCIIF